MCFAGISTMCFANIYASYFAGASTMYFAGISALYFAAIAAVYFAGISSVLHSGEGPVYAVSWCGSLIAWANDLGVKVYDLATNQRISFIERPKGSPSPEIVMPHVVWQDESLLIIGWGDCIKLVAVRTRGVDQIGFNAMPSTRDGVVSKSVTKPASVPSSPRRLPAQLSGQSSGSGSGEYLSFGLGLGLGNLGLSLAGNGRSPSAVPAGPKHMEVVAMFRTDYWVSGVAPYDKDLLVLAYITTTVSEDGADTSSSHTPSGSENGVTVPPQPAQAAQRPEIRILTWKNEELTSDALDIRGYEHFQANDYALAYVPSSGGSTAGGRWAAGDEPFYYVLSLKDVILAKPRDAEDHVEWLLKHGRYDKALEAVEAAGARPELMEEVGRRYLDHLLLQKKYADAAALCPKLLKGNAASWESRGGHGEEEEDVAEEDDENSEDDNEAEEQRWGRRRDGRRERGRAGGGRVGGGGDTDGEEGEDMRKVRRRGGMEDGEVRGGGGDKEDEEGQEEDEQEEETWRAGGGRKGEGRRRHGGGGRGGGARLKKEAEEQLKLQQARVAELAGQEAATDHSRREYLLQQLDKSLADDRCSQVTNHMAEMILLEHKITSSQFTNWDDRFVRLERRVDELSAQQSKILDSIQGLSAQLAAAKLITSQLPLLKPKTSPPPSPPPSPPTSHGGSVHSSRSSTPSQKASAKATYAAVTAADRGPKIPAPNKFRGDDPKTDWLRAVNPRINWQIPRVELPDRQGVYQQCMIAADHHPKTSCYCLRAREFHALSRQYHHERLFIALVKQTDAPPVSCPPEIQQVGDQYADLMQEPFGLPNRPTKHHIELLPGAVPPKGHVYRMSPAELEELRKRLETLTSKGWIRPSTSEFGAPVLFVPKGNGEFRMCIDYRGLNKITRKSTEPLPRIDDLLDMVQGCTMFSKVDLKSGYHQIEMAEEDVYKTAFKTRYGTYEFLVMPFGLCNAPGTFQTEMHRIFRPYLDKFMVVYLNDILVFNKTARGHAEHLALVLQSLRDSQYKINKENSSFGVPSVIYLGHVISGDGLAPEAAKIAAIQDPITALFWKEMRSDMLRYVDTCELCQRNKVHRKPPLGLLKPLPIPDGPAQSVSIDFTDLGKTTPRGMRQVMVCVDRFSKYAEFIPLPEVARVPAVRTSFSERWVTHHGPLTSIVSDRDPRFCSDEWQSYCKDYLHSRLDMTSGHHPEANGLAEVMNQVLFQLLRPVISPDQQDWDLHLARAQLMYNMSVHSSTGFSPYRLHWGREPRQPLDDIIDKAKPDLMPDTAEFARRYRLDVERARANLFKAQKAMIEQANRHRRPSPIRTGDHVWVARSEFSREEDISPKLSPLYLGPWQVLDTVGTNPFGPSYVIDVPLHLRTYPVFHASKLLAFTPADAFPDRPPQWGPPIPGKGYAVVAIEDEWGTGPDRQYLVRWVFHFAHLRQLPVLAPYIPTSSPQLKDTVYEVVLDGFLMWPTQYPRMLSTVRSWPSSIYTISNVIAEVQRFVSGFKGASTDLAVLEEVHSSTNWRAGNSVSQQGYCVPYCRPMLHKYLHAVFEKDSTAATEFHGLQVELYADYDRRFLLPLLRSSQHYDLGKAYDACRKRGLTKEMVFILGRMGNARQALWLIIDELHDVEQVGSLLEHTVGNIDPLHLMNKLPAGLEIPRLRDRLVKIITDYGTEMSLRQGCNDILKADCVTLLIKYFNEARHAIRVGEEGSDMTRSSPNLDRQESKRVGASADPLTTGTNSTGSNCLPGTSNPANDGVTGVAASALSTHRQMGGSGLCCVCLDPVSSRATPIVVFFCAHAYHLPCLNELRSSIAPPVQASAASAPLPLSLSERARRWAGKGTEDEGVEKGRNGGGQQQEAELRCVICTAAASARKGPMGVEKGEEGGAITRKVVKKGTVEFDGANGSSSSVTPEHGVLNALY
ncbi:hypothetical protein CBR_g63066 [Chara braunii]|uniref:Integrase catalytic domain-containing protein n=1 Tax=Chara braunii TaxID=69332 RepID=A0A388K971_CHABU|nr:hypothetical protein CBR_g63066 [Chara braunii]|eukprot:GBG66483.1 hypothetical protein CBR_g63066 [Chara braunii]